jgi:hypothetical protein
MKGYAYIPHSPESYPRMPESSSPDENPEVELVRAIVSQATERDGLAVVSRSIGLGSQRVADFRDRRVDRPRGEAWVKVRDWAFARRAALPGPSGRVVSEPDPEPYGGVPTIPQRDWLPAVRTLQQQLGSVSAQIDQLRRIADALSRSLALEEEPVLVPPHLASDPAVAAALGVAPAPPQSAPRRRQGSGRG